MYGNPFVIGRDGSRKDVLEKFEKWFIKQRELIAQAKIELLGKNLVCWCAPLACHGDIILKIISEEQLDC